MRVVSWNINSVRLRLALVERLIAEVDPDVLCLQEIKAQNADFPLESFLALGYRHNIVHGMKGYNGVAILSRLPLAEGGTQNWCEKEDCRHAFATLPGGIELHNFYVPAGGDIPDPALNPKFAHKLAFLAEMTSWWQARRKSRRKAIMLGDLNIAPLETDVWSHKQLLDVVSHTPIEVEWLGRIQAAHDWIDAVRHFVPPAEKLYSWWSYRARDWAAADRGRRLDHIWVTPPLADRLAGARILKEARGWALPSDHVPVIVDFTP
ncbi:MAG TPA: exodeoxyribonuclease III [Alphaproteobacteria bacterium]|nr:exodeoxyribonuclease III [Alphaproteobacteria bacterium]